MLHTLLLVAIVICIRSDKVLGGNETEKPPFIDHSPNLNCSCVWTAPFAAQCKITPVIDDEQNVVGSFNCSLLNNISFVSLDINCGDYTNNSTVHLRQVLGNRIVDGVGDPVQGPYEVAVTNCSIDWQDLQFSKITEHNVSSNIEFELQPFGSVWPQVAGYLTQKLHYNVPIDQESKCHLRSLKIVASQLPKLPSLIPILCSELVDLSITDSWLHPLSLNDLLSVSKIRNLTLRNLQLTNKHLQNPYYEALRQLNANLLNNTNNSSRPIIRKAVLHLQQLQQQIGELTDPKIIFYSLDQLQGSNATNFSFVLANTVNIGNQFQLPRASPLHTIILANNNLTQIPEFLSMLGELVYVDLSHNSIPSLYFPGMCWSPSFRLGACYWLRACKNSIYTLNLSHNKITFIGAVQPWFQVTLVTLDLSHNRIKFLNPSAFSSSLLTDSLATLSLSNNQLNHFELNSLTRIERLLLNDNDIRDVFNTSMPNSSHLTIVDLANNNINSVAAGCFKHLPFLEVINFTNNTMPEFNGDQFEIYRRPTLASRPLLLFGSQRFSFQYCTCYHVFVLSKYECLEGRGSYHYPRFSEAEISQFNCSFFSKFHERNWTVNTLEKASPDDYICPFYGSREELIPNKFCTSKVKPCTAHCVHSCYCWHGNRWSYSDMRCEGLKVDPFGTFIQFPVKVMVLVNSSGLGVSGKFTKNSFRWKSSLLSSQLRFLHMNFSHIFEIADDSFAFNHSIEELGLRGNRIRRLTSRTFKGLELSLKSLDLSLNQLQTFDFKIFNNFTKLGFLYLSNNNWVCSCEPSWLLFQQQLLESEQLISDLDIVNCTFSDKFLNDLQQYIRSNPSEAYSPVSPFPLSNATIIQELCTKMHDFKLQQRSNIIRLSLVIVSVLMLIPLLYFIVTRRYKLIGAVEMYFILKYMQIGRGQSQQKQCYDFDVFFLGEDEDSVDEVMSGIQAVFDRYQLRSSQSFDFSFKVSNSGQQLQQTQFETIEEGVNMSRTIVILLSNNFLATNFHDLLQALDTMVKSGRCYSDHVILVRMSPSVTKAALPHHSSSGQSEFSRKVLGALDILFHRSIILGSKDWQYKLATAVCKAKYKQFGDRRSGHHGNDDGSHLNRNEDGVANHEADTDEHSALMINQADDDSGLPSSVSTRGSELSDFAPFYGPMGCDIFIFGSKLQADPQNEILQELLLECQSRRLKLGTSEEWLQELFVQGFELTLKDFTDMKPEQFKQTRQVILLLGTEILARKGKQLYDWLKQLQETQVRRRLLIFIDSCVSDGTVAEYKYLANRHLTDEMIDQLPNAFTMHADQMQRFDWKRALCTQQRHLLQRLLLLLLYFQLY